METDCRKDGIDTDRGKCIEFIGQRFTVDRTYNGYLVSENYGDHRYKETFFIKEINCMLYKRPLINSIKSIFSKWKVR